MKCKISWDQLHAWYVYDHEIDLDHEGLDRADLRAARIAAEVHNVPIRMGWVEGKLLSPKDFMVEPYEERKRKQRGEADQSKLLCNTASLEEWRQWKEALKLSSAKHKSISKGKSNLKP